MVYTMMVYQWPKPLLHKLEVNINNFVWIGDVQKCGVYTIKLKNTCKPVKEGGIGLRSLKEFNMACMAKLATDFLKKEKTWCDLIHQRYYTGGVAINYQRCSSIWKGIKSGLLTISFETRWIIGRNSYFLLWRDPWLNGRSLTSFMSIPLNCNIPRTIS